MPWEEQTKDGLDIALNEAEVVGLRLTPSGAWCDVLLQVLTLPDVGPLDPDGRRVLRLLRPSRVTVLLREDPNASAGHRDVFPLADLAAVETFFASLGWSGAMYGWSFFDDPVLAQDWPPEPSLLIDVHPGDAPHSLYWFNECVRADTAYCLEGTVTFQDLEVLRADGTPEPLEQFIADGARYWHALHTGDERLSLNAQKAVQAATITWRPPTSTSITVPGASG